ncbi:MBL fold metallo-hydrolase [Rariglobus hedericola]|uniref:beta-lactamase n=1 Tax=Rariglobus hedericola TaxID=2597822 RepID=A0A556QK51_9BACT|nr:MBL fold metallo-hydrolase [Rariglobus hedericola]TSJ77024.1 MBL fold metallo-hydrolase [Rariglobus hedericola]
MNRRDFLVCSSLAVSAGVFGRSLAHAQSAPASGAPAATGFTALRRNVGLFTGRGGTIGWLVNKDALAVVDSQFPDTAQTFLTGLPGRDDRRVDVLLNTHHHGDHTGGNPVLKPVSKKVVAHANVPALLRAAAERSGKPLNPLTLPDETYADAWRAELGDETVSAKYFGPAHTRGDVVIAFEKANVVHMGDLCFNRIYPVIDRPGGGLIKSWIGVLEKVSAEYPADAIYVFGHSGPKFQPRGTRDDLGVFRDYLSGLLDYTQKQIDAGKTKAEITTLDNLPGFADFHQPLPNRLGANLGTAYDELTAKETS